ncbi:hypothetical protein BU15DRAFT_90993 [Melanogaster broomeanus]|nr:hypothetical protein BU15DRAFT_90993 [Melanogaster broomeanus]
MGRGKRGRRLDEYQHRFIQNNSPHWATEVPRKRMRKAEDNPNLTGDPRTYHKHTAVDVTERGRISVSSSYFSTHHAHSPGSAEDQPPSMSLTDLSGLHSGFESDDIQYANYLEETLTVAEKAKRKRGLGDDPHRLWLPERDTFLQEFLRLESRGDAALYSCCRGDLGCPESPQFRCIDCEGTQLFCQHCLVRRHLPTPLHRVEGWTGVFFERVTLKQLGLRIQLGHPVGTSCYNPEKAYNDDFVVLDMNGIHEIGLDFCNCNTAQSHTTQLLRARWYPATTSLPKSATTFRVLDHFQMYTFESKGSAFEYYQTLARLTDNTGTNTPKDRYEALLRMGRQYRHLLALKRAGRGHDPEGVLATKEGELAVICPACPHPGKNLPQTGTIDSWLYALFLAVDANFRLCRRDKSSEKADPSFNEGWAYFVEQSCFQKTLEMFSGKTQEKSTCVSHNAVNLADTRNCRGLAVTGVGAVDCARHNFKRPGAVGDLQKGERYVNMDYFFFSSMQHASNLITLNISYDITCQWSKHLWERMGQYPAPMHLNHAEKKITFLVPKFHLPRTFNHARHLTPSTSTKVWQGQMAKRLNVAGPISTPVATSTREMGPGSRRDALDDHFSDFNWKKICTMGTTLHRKLTEARPERDQHKQDLRREWRVAVERWEADHSNPNPFEAKGSIITQASVRFELARAEAADLQRGQDVSLHPDLSPSSLIAVGLDLERQPQRINALQRRIDHWTAVQTLYMPIVSRLRADGPPRRALSVIMEQHCDLKLSSIEWKLRQAQANEALRTATHLVTFKKGMDYSQRANTRSQTIIKAVQAKIDTTAEKYCTARTALGALAIPLANLDWGDQYPVLNRDDIRCMDGGLGANRESLRGSEHGSGELQEVMRIEWCKARARANRWAEEVELLSEEMRRVLAFLKWQAALVDHSGL